MIEDPISVIYGWGSTPLLQVYLYLWVVLTGNDVMSTPHIIHVIRIAR